MCKDVPSEEIKRRVDAMTPQAQADRLRSLNEKYGTTNPQTLGEKPWEHPGHEFRDEMAEREYLKRLLGYQVGVDPNSDPA